jgi:hypothetical protein
MRNDILKEIDAERDRQDIKWGGPVHDDKISPGGWCLLAQDYAGWARVMAGMDNPVKYRRRLLQVAAIAVAAIEALDRLLAKRVQLNSTDDPLRRQIEYAYNTGADIELKALDDPLSGWQWAHTSIAQQGFLWDTYDYRIAPTKAAP